MDIIEIKCFKGRNIYSHSPVIKSVVDLGEWYDSPTRDIPGFNESLVKALPGLSEHFCGCGHEGGFLGRMEEGTYPAHVIEHVTLELQSIIGYMVHFGKSRLLRSPSVYDILFEYKNEKLAVECLIMAVEIVNSLFVGNMPDIKKIILHLKKVDSGSSLGPSTRALYDEAARRGIPVSRLGNESILRLGYGRYSRYIEASMTDCPRCISIDITGDKHLTKMLLSAINIPVPYGDIAYTVNSAAVTAALVGYPVVVKPLDANQGKGVALNIKNDEELSEAFYEAAKFSRAVIVESYIKGRDYRVLVIGGKVAAVSERRPPFVSGDGIHTIKELVALENENPLRGFGHEKPLTKITLDNIALKVLKKNGFSAEEVPPEGCRVQVRENGNLSTGGSAEDCTDKIHPSNAALAIKAAERLGLDVAGVDVTAPDISRPIENGEGAIIEVNAAPGLRMHLFPSSGKPRNVAGDIIDMLYPVDSEYSIPIVSVTGTNGKTTVTRLIAHVLTLGGKTVGMTTTSGSYIGGECIAKGDNSGPAGAEAMLSDRRVEAAVLETARGGIIRKGLGYDLADVGIVTNISEDHLGLDGIETLEDLAYAKALVVEAVKKDGFAVLNADDGMTPFMVERARCRTVLFSIDADNGLISKHLDGGGTVVCTRDGSIYINSCGNEIFIMRVNEIPITFDGTARCNVENSLAAVSALYSLSVPINIIRKGLKNFRPDFEYNPGRFNLFEFDTFRIVLDYGHNPASYNAVVRWMSGISAFRYIGVIGMPGDRSDESIAKVGVISGSSFSYLYIKEDKDLRGRLPGETAGILYDSALIGGIGKEYIKIIHSETEALEAAVADAQAGDLIVAFCECYEKALETVKRLKKEENTDKAYDIKATG